MTIIRLIMHRKCVIVAYFVKSVPSNCFFLSNVLIFLPSFCFGVQTMQATNHATNWYWIAIYFMLLTVPVQRLRSDAISIIRMTILNWNETKLKAICVNVQIKRVIYPVNTTLDDASFHHSFDQIYNDFLCFPQCECAFAEWYGLSSLEIVRDSEGKRKCAEFSSPIMNIYILYQSKEMTSNHVI